MASNPGVTGRFFGALATASINVKAIAQGSSERNISVIIDQKDAKVRIAHSSCVIYMMCIHGYYWLCINVLD